MSISNPSEIVRLQRQRTEEWHRSTPGASESGFLRLVEENHLRNFLLWHEEDKARRNDCGAEGVYRAKRAIDRFNQERNDLMEQMDRHLYDLLKPRTTDCRFNSESPGMMVDRLSILALKEFHIREQLARRDIDDAHVELCRTRHQTILSQMKDLSGAFEELASDVAAGLRSFRVYFQLKMYNDPRFHGSPAETVGG